MNREYIQFGNAQIGYIEDGKLYILWFQPWEKVAEHWYNSEEPNHPLTLSSIITNTMILSSITANKEYANYVKEALEQLAEV